MTVLWIPPQPTLPAETSPNEVELAFIEEQPEGFPPNQDSNWGYLRLTLCKQLQLIVDEQETLYRNHFISTAVELLDMWEEMYGLPVESSTSLVQRRASIIARMKRGYFTRTNRREIVEEYVRATFGEAVAFGSEGITLDAGGVSLPGDAQGDVTAFYVIIENVENFSYNVGVSRSLGVDVGSMYRELIRLTPSGITLQLTEDYFKTSGAVSAASGGMVIDRTDL